MNNTLKLKNTWTGLAKSSLWLITFIVVQMLTATAFMLHKIFTDDAYADLYYRLVKPIYDSTSNSIDRAIQMTGVMGQLFSNILIPAMLVSNIIIVAIFCIVINRKSIISLITGKTTNFKERKNNFFRNTKEKILSKSCLNFIFLALVLNGVTSICSIIAQKLLPENIGIMHNESINLALSGPAILCLISTGILTPIAEEIIFRYGVKNSLSRISPKFGLIMQAVIFGLMHGNLIQCTYAIIMGYIFGVIDDKYKSILPSCIMHMVINSSSVILSFVVTSVSTEMIGYGIMGIVGMGYLLIANRKPVKLFLRANN